MANFLEKIKKTKQKTKATNKPSNQCACFWQDKGLGNHSIN